MRAAGILPAALTGAGAALLAGLLLWSPPSARAQEAESSDLPAVEASGLQEPEPPGAEEEQLPLLIPYREEVTVRLVYVPVHVRDRDGRPILDLTREDFELYVDGERVEIATFDPPLPLDGLPATDTARQGGTAPGSQAREVVVEREAPGEATGAENDLAPPPVPAGPSRVSVALLLDRYLTSMRFTLRGFHAAREFLSRELPPGMEVGLFEISHGDIRTVHPFSADRTALLAALAETERQYGRTESWASGGDMGSQAPIPTFCVLDPEVCAGVTAAGMQEKRHILGAMQGIERLSLAMADRPGRRSIVFLGVGLRMLGGYALVRRLGYCYVPCTVNNTAEFKRLVGLLKEANVTLTPVPLGGLKDRASDSLVAGAKFLSEETGGLEPEFLNDFPEQVAAAAQAPMSSYVLGFYGSAEAPGTAHDISVRVRRPDVSIAARSQWIEETAGFGSRISQAAMLLLPPPGTDPAGGLTALLRQRGRGAVLHLLLQVPADRLQWEDTEEGWQTARVSIVIRPESADGAAEEVFERPQTLQRSNGRTRPVSHIFEEAIEGRRLRKIERVTAQVRDLASGATLTWTVPLAAAVEEPKGPGRLSHPYLLSPAPGARLESAPAHPVLSRKLGGMLFVPVLPTRAGGGPYVVGALWSGDAEAAVRFCLTGQGGDCVQARTERLEEDGPARARVVPRAAWAITSAESLAGSGLRVEVRRGGTGEPLVAALEQQPPGQDEPVEAP